MVVSLLQSFLPSLAGPTGKECPMARKLFLLLVPLLLGLMAGPALAQATSTTIPFHGVTETFQDINPCTGGPEPALLHRPLHRMVRRQLQLLGDRGLLGNLQRPAHRLGRVAIDPQRG